MRLLLWLGLAAALAYFLLLGLVYSLQRSLIYLPDRSPLDAGRLAAPDWRTIETRSDDGLALRHLYRPGAAGAGPLLLAFHGNGGHAGHRVEKFEEMLGPERGLLLAEYRGYGGNPGKPSEEGLLADARSLLAWLETEGLAPSEVVLYGESLGSGVATALAAESATAGRPFAGLILESPFDSLAAVAQHHYWYLPARPLVRDRFDSAARIGAVAAPLLVLHAEADRVVPLRFGERLFEAAAEPKRLLRIGEGARHNDLYRLPAFRQAVRAFVGDL